FVNGTQQGLGEAESIESHEGEFCQIIGLLPAERAPVEGRRGKGVGSDCVGADWKTWRREP
ncbi:MAG TPA: hypothetical protein VIK58_03875, partial [Caldimonas sp.]